LADGSLDRHFASASIWGGDPIPALSISTTPDGFGTRFVYDFSHTEEDIARWQARQTAVPDTSNPLVMLAVSSAGLALRDSSGLVPRTNRNSLDSPRIGPQRVADLAINVILPWFWMRAVAGQNYSLQRLARQRLFGASKARAPAPRPRSKPSP
jgi:hypothetical protein